MDKISGFLLNEKTGKMKLILLYRYFSLAVTSIFYLIGVPSSSFIFKVGVIISLFIAAILVKDLLSKNEGNPIAIKWIVMAETVGITLLLLPTSGIESPFIWYAVNPALIAASYLSGIFCWVLLTLYMTAAVFLSNTFFMNQSVGVFDMISQNSYLVLVLLLITIVFQLFAKLTNELHSQAITLEKQQRELLQANKNLVLTNEKSNEAMEHIMSLYQTIELFTAQDNVQTLVKTVLSFTEKLTKTPITFCWLSDGKHHAPIFSNNKEMSTELQKQVMSGWIESRKKKDPFTMDISGETFHLVNVQSTNYHGFIGIEIQDRLTDPEIKLMKFLGELTSVILERLYLKQVSDQFLIVEEQNRIANEIHDSVSQRVFGLVFGLHSIKKKIELLPKDKLKDEIQFLSDSASMAMKELRSSIYQLSTKKRGEALLFSKVQEFLSDVAQLNGVTVIPDFQGDEEKVTYKLKQAIYRIICEASGNALKHGNCKKIKVAVLINDKNLQLSIIDDGIGFDTTSKMNNKNGIGLGNMKNLVHSFGGSIVINSRLDKGTSVNIDLPLFTQNQEVVGL